MADAGNLACRQVFVDVLEVCLKLLQRLSLRQVVGKLLNVSEPRLTVLPIHISRRLHAATLLPAVARFNHPVGVPGPSAASAPLPGSGVATGTYSPLNVGKL